MKSTKEIKRWFEDTIKDIENNITDDVMSTEAVLMHLQTALESIKASDQAMQDAFEAEIAHTTGDDMAAYKAKLREEIIEELRAAIADVIDEM